MEKTVEAWFTYVATDKDAFEAVRLSNSLKKVLTKKQFLVIVSPNINNDTIKTLETAFHGIYFLPPDSKLFQQGEISAIVYALSLVSYKKLAYLNPSSLVSNGADEIFDNTEGDYIGSNGNVLVEPSSHKYKVVVDLLLKEIQNKNSISPNGFRMLFSTVFKWKDLDLVYESAENSLKNDTEIMTFENESNHIINGNGMVNFNKDHLYNGFNGLHTNNNAIQAKEVKNPNKESIAIVGYSCRMPGANNMEEYWEIFKNGECWVRPPPEDRWTTTQCDTRPANTLKTEAGFLCCGIEDFDAKFFGISPQEVEFLDPQHRLILEVAWEALEDAAINPHSLKGSNTSVFSGLWNHGYNNVMMSSGFRGGKMLKEYVGNGFGMAAARVAYTLGVGGKVVGLDAACSSSSVALGLAVDTLRNGSTNLAIACGANLLLEPFSYKGFPGVVSPDYRSKSFDSNANGFARSEGCGVVILKRLSDAVADGDNIHTLVRGYGSYQEGESRSIGTPTVNGIARAIKAAIKDANISPADVQLIEAHATGTAVGDPIEIKAIQESLSTPERKTPLIIVSGKANTGHVESVAGLAGIFKTVLSMKAKIIPQQILLNEINTEIHLDKIPAIIPLETTQWKSKGPRIAAVNCNGFSGTNTCVILEEYIRPSSPPPPSVGITRKWKTLNENIVLFSAQSKENLRILLNKYHEFLIENPKVDLTDLAYTANTGRANFPYRTAIRGKNIKEIMDAIGNSSYEINEAKASKPKICFLFTGQGSHYYGMGKILYENFPIFQTTFDEVVSSLESLGVHNIKEVFWGCQNAKMDDPTYCQTMIFGIEYALAQLLNSWGIKPDCVLGHSFGEFASTVVAGLITYKEVLQLIVYNAKQIRNLPPGRMIAVNIGEDEAIQLVKEIVIEESENHWLDIACVNGPTQTTISGTPEAIATIRSICKERQIKCHILDSPYAFHSRHIDTIIPFLKNAPTPTKYPSCNSGCKFFSTVNGKEMVRLNPEYWIQHRRQPVYFMQSVLAIKNVYEDIIFVECGPHAVLSPLIPEIWKSNIKCIPLMRKSKQVEITELGHLLDGIGSIYQSNHEINFNEFYKNIKKSKIHLPKYPFQRSKFWFSILTSNGNKRNSEYLHHLLGSRISIPPIGESQSINYQSIIPTNTLRYLEDHKIGEYAILPGAGYLAMALALGKITYGSINPIQVNDFTINAPLILESTSTNPVHTHFNEKDSIFHIFYRKNNSESNSLSLDIKNEKQNQNWTQHSAGKIIKWDDNNNNSSLIQFENLQYLKSQIINEESTSEIYLNLSKKGYNFGDLFRSIKKVWKLEKKNEDLMEVFYDTGDKIDKVSVIHPVVLDGMIQSIIISQLYPLEGFYLPVGVKKFIQLEGELIKGIKLTSKYYIHVKPFQDTHKAVLYSENGVPLGIMIGLQLSKTELKPFIDSLGKSKFQTPSIFEQVWEKQNLPQTYTQIRQILDSNGSFNNESGIEKLTQEVIIESRILSEYIGMGLMKMLMDLGWNWRTKGENITIGRIKEELKIPNELQRSLKLVLNIICEDGFLQQGSGDFVTIPQSGFPNSSKELEIKMDTLRSSSKGGIIDHDWLMSQVFLDHLPNILQGIESPLEILFPSNPTTAQFSALKYYPNSIQMTTVQNCLNKFVKKVLDENLIPAFASNPELELRILEIGAGTGSATRCLLPLIHNSGLKYTYTYTDISSTLVGEARDEFGENENVIFKTLDISKEPKDQGFTPNFYNIVIAANVLHATPDLSETLSNIRHLISDEFGILLISETIRPLRPIDISFGLLDGYNNYTDTHIRPNHCLVSPSTWTQILKTTGYSSVSFGLDNMEFGYEAIIAQASNETFNYKLQPSPPQKRWIIMGEKSKISNQLGKKLTNYGKEVTAIDNWNENSELPSDTEGIVYFGQSSEEETNDDKLPFKSIGIANEFLQVFQRTLQLKATKPPRTYLVTRGLVPLVDATHSLPTASPLEGLLRSFRTENLMFPCKAIDLALELDGDDGAGRIIGELWNTHSDMLIAHSKSLRYIARLKPTEPELLPLSIPPNSHRSQLKLPATKSIMDLKFVNLQKNKLNPNEVEIEVRASGLNFKNIFSILKPTDDFMTLNQIGGDFAGVITEVGAGCTKWTVGDPVLGYNVRNEALPTHVISRENDLARIPDKMTFAEASTLPVAFMTTFHCLITVAKMKKGDRLLLHTASGAVGLCAYQLAQHVGAEVIATAGSNRKREYLRRIGIRHVFNYKNLEFQNGIMKITNDQGVDIVLNSVTGPGLKEASLGVCAKNGHFVEMSRLNIWTKDEVSKMRPDVNYSIQELSLVDSETLAYLFSQLGSLMEKGVIGALPCTTFPANRIREGLKYLEGAKHIGKVVIRMPEYRNGIPNFPLFNDRSTYLITGGTRGIGLELLKWMIVHGGKHFVLVGRKSPSDETVKIIQEFRNEGINVVTLEGNVGDFEDCKNIFARIDSSMQPLRGVMHCAGVIEDATIPNQNYEKLMKTFRAKVFGGWNLHQLTKNRNLEHFVMYSSMVALIGAPGQANHSAANAFLDNLAHYRRSIGLPSASINWGHWGETGVAVDIDLQTRTTAMSTKGCLECLESVMRMDSVQNLVCNGNDVNCWKDVYQWLSSYIEPALSKDGNSSTQEQGLNADTFWPTLESATDIKERKGIISKVITQYLISILRLSTSEVIESHRSFRDLGLDSLMTIELKNKISLLIQEKISLVSSDALNAESLEEMVTRLYSLISPSLKAIS